MVEADEHKCIAAPLQVNLYADCIGLLSAAFFVVYLAIGRAMRSWMPIFAYVLPVNVVAALSLCCAAVLIDGAGFDMSPHGIFGYLGSWTYFWRSVYLGAVPGIVGHVTFNALLKWLHPLLLALPGDHPTGVSQHDMNFDCAAQVLCGCGSDAGVDKLMGITVVAYITFLIFCGNSETAVLTALWKRLAVTTSCLLSPCQV